MGTLNILGAQRVKALIEVLEAKKAMEIAELKKTLPTMDDIKAQVDAEFGIDGVRAKFNAAFAEAKELAKALQATTGYDLEVQTSGWRSKDTEYGARVNAEFKRQHTDKVEEVEARYKALVNKLWLCESLEEAKELVGL